MPTARGNLVAGLIGRRIYAAGGWQSASATPALEVFDTAAGSWRSLAPMPRPRAAAGAVVDGKLYAAGGFDGGQCSGDVAVYDPSTGEWSALASMPTPRCGASAAAFSGRLYVIGGTDTSGRTRYHAAEIYDPGANSWSVGAPMPTGRGNAAAVTAGNHIFVMGGSDGSSCLANVEAYDPVADAWFVKTPMPRAYESAAAAALNGLIYVAGGGVTPVPGVAPGEDDDSMLLVYDPRRDDISRPAPRVEAPVARLLALARPAQAPFSDVDSFTQHATVRPNDFALIVGIDGYRSVPHAAYGERDATVFKLYAQGVLGVPEENVILLTGDKASRTDLVKYLEEWLPKNVSRDSRVYFFYSGHGAPDPEKGTAYLVPWDGDPEFLQSSAYPLSLLYKDLTSLEAKEIVVFLDSCFSGAGGRSLIAANLRPLVTVQDSPRLGSKLSVLTASTGGEVAESSDAKGHGLFTYYLLRGLQGDADAQEGHVRLDGLFQYVERNVLKAAHRENREQHPKLTTSTPDLRLY